MKAAVYEQFQSPLIVGNVPDPRPNSDAAIIQVAACGICRSDWHGWMGHDSDIQLPHVPGHELAGTIAAVGSDVRRWKTGQRITVPFSCGCGRCRQCLSGNLHICDDETQPGFTQWGAFAEFVEIRHADLNLVELPESIDFATAASLGCRFATSFRGLMDQARVQPGEWVAVYGCGGVGLSAVMIAVAAGAQVIAVDIDDARLQTALELGADEVINAGRRAPRDAIMEMTAGGGDVSVDALGSRTTCFASIGSLRKRGRHVQIGLTLGSEADPPIPMSEVIANELVIMGSHGMPSTAYPRMLRMIEDGQLHPQRLIRDHVTLEEGAALLVRFDDFPGAGVTVIDFR
ncbi:MAG: zinc-dependent alcohol dehydrogenase family protein [Planctomycetaceae bacterium]